MRRSRRQARALTYKKPRARLSHTQTASYYSPVAPSLECLEDRRMLAPVAESDYAVTLVNQSATIYILANDYDSTTGPGTPLNPAEHTATFLVEPTKGTWQYNDTTGALVYAPFAGFAGRDSIVYQLTNNTTGELSNLAIISIDILQGAITPVAFDDYAATQANHPIQIPVLENDFSTASPLNPSSIQIVEGPTRGTVTLNRETGVITYNPHHQLGNYYDTFQYRVFNQVGMASNIATVQVYVDAIGTVNAIGVPDFIGTVYPGTSPWFDLIANDYHPSPDLVLSPDSIQLSPEPTPLGSTDIPITAPQQITTSKGGIVTIYFNEDNPGNNYHVAYTPAANTTGDDYFYYRASVKLSEDPLIYGFSTGWTRVNVIIGHTNQPPVAHNVTGTMPEDTEKRFNINATDIDGYVDPFSLTIRHAYYGNDVNTNILGTDVFVDQANNQILVRSKPGFVGQITVQYTVRDNDGLESNVGSLIVNVTPVPKPPVAVNDTITTEEDTPVDINVLLNDTDPDGIADIDPTTVTITTPPLASQGSVTVNPTTGVVRFTPAANYYGPAAFQYQVSDRSGLVSNTATVIIDITPVNDPPTLPDQLLTVATDGSVQVNVPATGSDPDDGINPASVRVVDAPTNGTISINAVTGVLTYTPAPGFAGYDRFTVRVSDHAGADSSIATYTARVGDSVSISGSVFVDSNGNGIRDGADLGLAGILITLEKTDGPITFTETTTTNAAGQFVFNSTTNYGALPAGTYNIRAAQSPLYLDGPEIPGTPPPTSIVNDGFIGITLGSGQHATGYHFSERGPGSISGVVYEDRNDNGVRDAGEVGIAGVEIILTRNGSPGFTLTTTTDANGVWVFNSAPGFTGLPPGTYSVRQVQPAGRVDGKDTTTVSGVQVLNDEFRGIALASGQTLSGFAFGELAPVTVSGMVFVDLNNNGLVDPGEPGIPGVTIRLAKTNGPDTFVIETQTTATGGFLFESHPNYVGLPPGTYDLSQVQPAGYADGQDRAGSPPPLFALNDNFRGIVLGSGQGAYAYTFGERLIGGGGGTPVPPTPEPPAPGPSEGPLAQTIAVYSPLNGSFYLRSTNAGGAADLGVIPFGQPNWIPLSGDWNGDGVDTIGVFDPQTATFYLNNANNAGAPSYAPIQFGAPGWQPIVGDWDGNGTDTIGVFDPVSATFFLRNSNSAGAPDIAPFQLGVSGWTAVAGDFDGDGVDTVGVYNPAGSTFYLQGNYNNGTPIQPFTFGAPGWRPVVGDFNGDGVDGIGVQNPYNSTFYLRNVATAGAPDVTPFYYGGAGWRAVFGNWNGGGGNPLIAAAGPASFALGTQITTDEIVGLLRDAVGRWEAAGLAGQALQSLAATPVEVVDLPGSLLGYELGGVVYLDHDAAGHGWSLGKEVGPAMDALTVLAHELGHTLGLDDHELDPTDIMYASLEAGVRRLPTVAAVDRVLANYDA